MTPQPSPISNWSKPEPRPGFLATVIDLLMFIALLWYLTPVEFIVPIPLLLGSRLITWMLLLIFGGFALQLTLRFSMTRWTMVSLFSCVAMMAFGFLRLGKYFETEVFGNDVLTFFSLIAGLIWASTRSYARILGAFRLVAAVSTFALIVTLVGLRVGFVTAVYGEERLITQSMYTATFTVASLLPLIVLPAKGEKRQLSGPRLILFVIGLAAVFAAGVLSAGRTVTVQGAVALAVCAAPIFTQRRSKATAAILLAGAVLSVFAITGSQIDLLRERAASTSTDNGNRFEEVVTLLDQVSHSLITGWGFGSLFDSPNVLDEYGLAAAPHVGVLAFLQKGGIMIFAIFIVVPIYICLRGLLRDDSNTIAYGAAGSLAVYMATGFLSGGWFTVQMFVFGACISLATYARNSNLPSRNLYTSQYTAQYTQQSAASFEGAVHGAHS